MVRTFVVWSRVCLLIVFLVGTVADRAVAQQPMVRLEEVMTIGRADAAPSAALKLPSAIATDSKGRIYIADRPVLTVKVYNEEGDYLQSIGGPGTDKGQFQQLTAMTVNQQDHLIVADMFARRITRFSSAGQVTATHPMPLSKMKWPRRLYQFSDGRYAVLFKQKKPEGAETHLIHVFDRDFLHEQASFGRIEELWPVDSSKQAQSGWLSPSLRPGEAWIDNTGRLLYTPALCDGRIYRFEESGNRWKAVNTLHGRAPSGPLLERKGDQVNGHSESRGLFTLSDGRVVHFSAQQVDGAKIFGVEIFDTHGRYIGYNPVKSIDIPANETWDRYVHVAWKDEEDRFYLIDDKPTGALVRIFRLNFN